MSASLLRFLDLGGVEAGAEDEMLDVGRALAENQRLEFLSIGGVRCGTAQALLVGS